MKINSNLSQIRAEVLLSHLYPEMEERWKVHHEGAFFRNYNGDTMSIDEATGEVRLSRDGFMRLLPQGVLTDDEELKGEDAAERVKKLEHRLRVLHEAFLPFDTYAFQKKLAIERQVSRLLDDKLSYVLSQYFGFDLPGEKNHLVRQAAVLLPFVCRYKGDLGFISNILAALMRCEVKMHLARYSHTDTSKSWLPFVKYELLIPGLTAPEYRKRSEDLQPLADFLREWMLPCEVHCEICIKEHGAGKSLDERFTLDYNTELR